MSRRRPLDASFLFLYVFYLVLANDFRIFRNNYLTKRCKSINFANDYGQLRTSLCPRIGKKQTITSKIIVK